MKEAPSKPTKEVDLPSLFSGRTLVGADHIISQLVRTSGVARQFIQPVCVYHPLAKYAFQRCQQQVLERRLMLFAASFPLHDIIEIP
jgi:hypothetical protein